jgi:LCP family protein required for cell wall assembly
MVASIDRESRKSAFLSLPRDLFVPIPESDLAIKLNSLYQYGLSQDEGVEPLRVAVENITGLDIPYTVIVDFDGFEHIIDEVGGVTVYSERDILDTRYPGKNYSYETFELSAGWHTLDGATALKYARERHSDPEGDFGRAKRQQQILKAFQEKVFSVRTLINAPSLSRILDTLGSSVRTNLTVPEILELADLTRTIDIRNASTVVVDAWRRESLLRVSHIDVGGVRAFILVPRVGNWSEIRDLAENIFSLEAIERRREAIERESATIHILSRPEDASVARRFMHAIEDAIPTEEITLSTDETILRQPDSTLYEEGSSRKLYSVDELLRLFSLTKTTTTPDTPSPEGTDITLVIGSELEDTLIEEDATIATDRDDIPESDPFSEYFPAQSR